MEKGNRVLIKNVASGAWKPDDVEDGFGLTAKAFMNFKRNEPIVKRLQYYFTSRVTVERKDDETAPGTVELPEGKLTGTAAGVW